MPTREDVARSGLTIFDLSQIAGIPYLKLWRVINGRTQKPLPDDDIENVRSVLARRWTRQLVAIR